VWASVACFKLAANAFERAGVCVYQSHRLERVVPTYVPAGVRSRGFVAACFVQVGVVLLFVATP